ncbi:uncharacterized protein LOC116293453 [Actinia tenebrosa]|uniref:Uncharacterized protein LOC116293453 n=1 Tax=Actinia tenebrosa TaxID=6105 RepID=A0A6P8HNW9_ACTTE|nr:uncharacterized protein LOC116293453 [Actinia tenebrosa]
MGCFPHQGMERKDYLIFVLLLASIFGNTVGLRCYSCTTEGSKCSYTIGCHGECYKASAERTFTYVHNKSETRVVTTTGCITNCSIEEQKRQACYGNFKDNCELDCCSTDYCNRLMLNDTGFSGGQGYPSCHSCSSTDSYEHCQARSSLTTCSYTTGTPYCYKMDYKSLSRTKKRIYKKGCVRSFEGCESLRTAYCGVGNSADCNVYCCSGKACNVGKEKIVSVYVILACVAVAIGFGKIL